MAYKKKEILFPMHTVSFKTKQNFTKNDPERYPIDYLDGLAHFKFGLWGTANHPLGGGNHPPP